MQVLCLLLVAFPMAVALVGTPLNVAILFLAMVFVAYKYHCLKPFLSIIFSAFAINFFLFSGMAMYSDADFYLQPAIRMLSSPIDFTPDGLYAQTHMGLPKGFIAWSSVLYQLTGWIDAGNCLLFILLPVAWLTLRQSLPKLQTAALLIAPLLWVSILCAMPDGCVYLLLLIALFSLHQKSFWLPLLACVAASCMKTTAWIPTFFIFITLFHDQPKKWHYILVSILFMGIYLLPILYVDASQAGADFMGANADAKAMGYWARQAYAYLGHWTTALQPNFNVPTGGIDGGGIDGLGPFFRVFVWISLAVLIIKHRFFKPWWRILLLMWGSLLVIPTPYIGYGRYVPLLYPAVMFPLLLLCPRLSLIGTCAVNCMPVLWLGWRVILSTENLYVLQHATAVSSQLYNIRCMNRTCLVETSQAQMNGSLFYTYTLADGYAFPVLTRIPDEQRLCPATEKMSAMLPVVIHKVLPWYIKHLPENCATLVRYRLHCLIQPRGIDDEPQTP